MSVRVTRLGTDETPVGTSAAERIQMVLPLTVEAWTFKNGSFAQSRLQRHHLRVRRGVGDEADRQRRWRRGGSHRPSRVGPQRASNRLSLPLTLQACVTSNPFLPLPMRILTSLLLLVATGCATTAPPLAYDPQPEPPELSFAISAGDGMSETMLSYLLDVEVVIPGDARVAVLQMPGVSDRRSYYLTSERQVGSRQARLDTLRALLISDVAREVELLPSLLVPASPSIDQMRELAVRLQADLLLVYRVDSDLYRNFRAFRSDEFRAYATCEAVLLDVRTGALPFTTVVTRKYQTRKQDGDLTDEDAQSRAREQAALSALRQTGRELSNFLETQPNVRR